MCGEENHQLIKMLHESQANLKTANLEISKLQDKNQVLTQEFLELKAATDVKIQVSLNFEE